MNDKKSRNWSDNLWMVSSLYLLIAPFNILFAWLGLLCFFIPLLISMFHGSKLYCNKYCGRGQLFYKLGNKLKLSRKKPMPKWMVSKQFRYGFLIFFFIMFGTMLVNTYYVFQGTQSLKQVIKLLWTFKLPWNFIQYSYATPWVVQFAFGFYSLMITSTILGVITMLFYQPRSWCVYCPMGTMTQGICKVRYHLNEKR